MENNKHYHLKQERFIHNRTTSNKNTLHSKSHHNILHPNNHLTTNNLTSIQLSHHQISQKANTTTKKLQKHDKNTIKQNINSSKINKIYPEINGTSQKLTFSTPHVNQLVKLLFATLLDTSDIEQNLKKIPLFPLTIPYIYQLILLYEGIFSRAYTQQIRYYIIGVLWDQGYAKVGTSDQWQQFIEQEHEQQNKKLQKYNSLAEIDKIRDIYIQKYQTQQADLGQNKQQARLKFRDKLSTSFVMLIEAIQSQYHRENITLQKLYQVLRKEKSSTQQEDNNNNYKAIEQVLYIVFDGLDRNKVGTLGIGQLLQQFNLKQQRNKSIIQPYYIINKICNNLHNLNKSTNRINNPYKTRQEQKNKNKKLYKITQLNSFRIRIQNLLELINRIYTYQQNKSIQEHISSTYNSIHYIISKYKQMENLLYNNRHTRIQKQLQNRNNHIIILAQMENIKQAATTIVKCRKNIPINTPSPFSNQSYHPIYNQPVSQELYSTNKYSPEMNDQQQLTFRHKTHNLTYDSANNMNLSRQEIIDAVRKERYTGSTGTGTGTVRAYRSVMDNPVNQFDNSRQISQFIITKQAKRDDQELSSGFSSGFYKKRIENYDNLLRARIESQLRVVQLQKLKNRMKYYQILYK